MSRDKWIVDEINPTRLDKYLAEINEELSRSYIQQ